MVQGIDISHYQGDVDFSVVKSAGYSFVFVKLTEGQTYIDPKGKVNVKGAKSQGMAVGGYHFARFLNEEEAKKEADFFHNVAKDLGLDYVILDIEHKEAIGDMTEASLVFLDIVSDLGKPVFYSYSDYIKEHFNKAITKYPLWVAEYGVNKPQFKFWSDWSIWQKTSNVKVPGVNGNCDVNEMKDNFLVKHTDPKPQLKKPTVQAHGIYHVQSGDNFWDLEQKHGWQHGILVQLNPNVDPGKLQIGQVINVPESVSQPVSQHKYHTVKSGDSLSLIASNYGISLQEIETLNPQIHNFNVIQPGEKVRVK